MFTLEVKVGRLLEGRVFGLANLEDVDAYSAAAVRQTELHKEPLILCADHRRAGIYSQPVADKLVELFGKMNTRLERVAVVVSKNNAMLALQLERLVREAQNPRRRVFSDVGPAIVFLSATLDLAETNRLREFLGEPLT